MTTTSSHVIVLGAGPVGLGAALELARFGVPTVLVEKHDGTSWHPKTRNWPPVVEDSYSDYVQSATPGCRAPHVWLGRSDAELSTLDLLGPAFTLLTAAAGGAWSSSAAEVARDLGVPINAYTIGGAGLSDRGGFARTYGLNEDGAVQIRPDGYVAWPVRKGHRHRFDRRAPPHTRTLNRRAARAVTRTSAASS